MIYNFHGDNPVPGVAPFGPTYIPPELRNVRRRNEYFVQAMSDFTDSELNRIRELAEQETPYPISMFGRYTEENVKARSTRLPYTAETAWIYERIGKSTQQVNEEHWNYDLTGFGEEFAYRMYDGDKTEHFDYHLDTGPETHMLRKLTVTLQLCSPDEYEGGDFDIYMGRVTLHTKKAKGLFTFFPGFWHHRVTPVTSGQRRVLNGFTVGPNFR